MAHQRNSNLNFNETSFSSCQSSSGSSSRLLCSPPWFWSCIYFNDVCTPLTDIPGRSSRRAADRCDLLVPSSKTKIGSRSFPITAPAVWNSPPLHQRGQTISERQFPSGLNTHLFILSFENYLRMNSLTYSLTYLLTSRGVETWRITTHVLYRFIIRWRRVK